MLGVLTTHGLRCWMTGYHLNGYPSLLVPLASGEPSSKKLRWFSLTTECCWVWITREICMKLVKVPQERNQGNKVPGCNGLSLALLRMYLNPTPFPLCSAGSGHKRFSYPSINQPSNPSHVQESSRWIHVSILLLEMYILVVLVLAACSLQK